MGWGDGELGSATIVFYCCYCHCCYCCCYCCNYCCCYYCYYCCYCYCCYCYYCCYCCYCYYSPQVALLIEPRCHKHLEYVIRNASWFLGPTWQLQVFHGSTNLQHIRAAFSAAELEHVQLLDLGVDNLSPLAHNELMCTHWLWSRAAAERVLVFQTDSLICRAGVEAFQRWDYVGAPWRADDLWCVGKPWLMAAGNGGFSLRSRAKTLQCLDSAGYVCGQCEDVFYAENIPKVGGKLATRAEASRFSVESVYAPDPFGFHAAYKWLSSEEMHQLLHAIKYS